MEKDHDQNSTDISEAAVSPTKRRKELQTRLWIELIKTCFFILAAVSVIIFGTIAWFASNTQVQASGVSVSAQNQTIRLATKGERQLPDVQFSGVEESGWNLEDGTPFDSYFYTETQTIALRMSNANTVVSPGARGVVEFYIIPTEDGDIQTNLYVGLGVYQEEKKNHSITNQLITGVKRIRSKPLEAVLNGHILLFREYSNGYYSGWMGSGSSKEITVNIPNAKKDEPVPVRFYWIWPLEYRNMKDNLIDPSNTEEYDRFQAWVEAQADITGKATVAEDSKYKYSQIFLWNKDATEFPDALRDDAYNLADEYIGGNTHYLYLTIQTKDLTEDTPE